MTGFGEAERVLEDGVLRVEIKTVNHRFFNASVRTPPGFDRIEHELQGWLRPLVSRGHVHLVVSFVRPQGRDADLPQLDMHRARHYAGLLRRLRDELDLTGSPDVHAVARFGDIFRVGEAKSEDAAPDTEVVRNLVETAGRALVRMREIEGARLQKDMEERLAVLASEVERVAQRAPERLVRERDRLRAVVAELTGQTELDEDRLTREIVYLAERWDLNEEVVRFRSHLQLFRETLAAGDGEPVGKRLSFIVQEMHREANTIGSKANDSEIAHASVAMKEEIERLREQVENVE
jgi:uncharacterized protein (TIGR00255 family)